MTRPTPARVEGFFKELRNWGRHLKEFRTALVSAAVTEKIYVREARAAP